MGNYFSDWLIRTVGGRGARDAARGYPGKEHFTEVQTYDWPQPSWEMNKFQKRSSGDSSEASQPVTVTGTVKLAPYEASLVSLAEESVGQEQERWAALSQKPEAMATQIHHEMTELLREYESACNDHRKKGNRQTDPKIGKWVYLALLSLLGLFELPLNMSALQILYLPNEETILISSGVALMFMLLAHFIGLRFRYWPKEKQHWVVYLGIFAMLLAVFGSILSIGVLRGEYLAHETGKDIDWLTSVALMALNFAYLIGGAGLSYLAHDRDEELERIVKAKQKLQKRLTHCWKKLIEVSTRFDTLLKTTAAKMNNIRNDALAKILEYRDYNRRFRSDDNYPECFNEKVDYFLFKPIILGHELVTHPESINELIKRIEEETDVEKGANDV